MNELFDFFVKSGFVVWSFPLRYSRVPLKVKSFLDRTLPIFRPVNIKFVEEELVVTPAVLRSQKHIIISSYGYVFPSSHKAVCEMFAYNFGERTVETIFCKGWQACLINKSDLRDEYLSKIKQAGKEHYLFEKFSEKTKEYLLNTTCDEKEFYSDFVDYFDLNIDQQ